MSPLLFKLNKKNKIPELQNEMTPVIHPVEVALIENKSDKVIKTRSRFVEVDFTDPVPEVKSPYENMAQATKFKINFFNIKMILILYMISKMGNFL